ncbi:hypothetical protein HHX47_DHR3000381 [Lentinula edodes]|nr:hypothetical protein HHX47_DHR3000381 [Lentinula edodes]
MVCGNHHAVAGLCSLQLLKEGIYPLAITLPSNAYQIRIDLQVALLNAVLFLGSIAGFMFILVHNAQRRRAVIASAIALPLPGCPSIHTGIEWAQWVPATIYEGILFGYALCKTVQTNAAQLRRGGQISLRSVLLRDNLVYFFGPFHAAVGMLTTRMMLNVHKAANKTTFISGSEVELPATTTNLLPSAGGASGWNVAQNSQLTGASLRA